MKPRRPNRDSREATNHAPVLARATMGARLSGRARGSQVVLLAFVFAGFIVVIAGVCLAALAPHSALLAWFVVALGGAVLLGGLFLWMRSQPLADKPPELPAAIGSLTVRHGKNLVTVVGDSGIMRSSSEFQRIALDIISNRMARRPLPKASGKVNGEAADAQSIVQFSPSEADADYAEVAEIVEHTRVTEDQALAAIAAYVKGTAESSAEGVPQTVLAVAAGEVTRMQVGSDEEADGDDA
ncbi:hypothetical protein [Sorangium sp. So ce1335]|uniref:hypothetical protein n=1 Tax=Sorangium sp. So ce1335 TaxID=3133335 RepID=UPI003F63007B